MPELRVAIQRFPGTSDLPLPSYQTEQSAAMDLAAAVVEPVVLEPGGRALIGCGFAVAVPAGYEAQASKNAAFSGVRG